MDKGLIGLRTLVLDAGYQPMKIFPDPEDIPAEDAITRVLNGTCHVVTEYDRAIQTKNLKMNWPAVIARNSNEGFVRDTSVALKRKTLFYRDHGLCAYCERPITISTTTYDHVIPQWMGGETTWENIVAACDSCNHRKGNKKPVGEWVPKARLYAPTYWEMVDSRKKFPVKIRHESWRDFIGKWHAEIKVLGAA